MKKIVLIIVTFILFFLYQNIEAKELENSNYIVTTKLNNNMVVDLSSGKVVNGGNIQLYINNDSIAQKWYFKKTKDGYYTISSSKNNKYVLDVSGGKFKNSSNVQLYQNNNSNAQKWRLLEDEEGYYEIVSYNEKYVLDLSGGKSTLGTNIQIYQRNKTSAQKFAINKEWTGTKTISDGIYSIKTLKNDLFIDTKGSNIANSSNIILKKKNDNNTQNWYIEYIGNGLYSITTLENSLYSLDVQNGKKTKYANIDLYISNDTNSQKWIIRENSDKSYSIISKQNGMFIEGKELVDEGNIGVTRNETENSKFIFTKKEYTDELNGEGNYTITTKLNNNVVVDLSSGKVVNGGNIQLYINNDSIAQKWYFKKTKDGYYTISSSKNNKYVLDVSGGKFNNSANVQLYQNNNSNAQKWRLLEDEEGYYEIVSYNEKYVLDLSGGKSTLGTNVQLYQRNKTSAQKFAINKEEKGSKTIESGIYSININNGNFISIENNNILVKQDNIQKWVIKYLDNGYYSISPYENTTHYLSVYNNNKIYKSNIALEENVEYKNNQWIIKNVESDKYKIISKSTGLSLDYQEEKLIINKDSNESSQKFSINRIEDFGEKTLENGYYFINLKLDNTKSIDINNGEIIDNGNIQIFTSNSSLAQKWYVEYIDNGYYKILSNKNSSYSLTSDSKYSSNIKISTYNDLETQKWVIKDNGNGYYSILNKNYLSLNVDDSSLANKTNISLAENNNSSLQQFKFIKTSEGIGNKVLENGYYFINSFLDQNYVVDLASAKTLNGNNIQLYVKNSSDAQKWYLTYISNGYYKITSALSNKKSLDIKSGGINDGTNVQIYDYNNSYSQQWIIKDAGDGSFYIVSNNGGTYLDIDNSSVANGTNIEMNSYTGNASQKFTFTKTMLEKIVIDVSKYQGNINWGQVAGSGIYGAIIRISAGYISEDEQLANNIAGVKKYNIPYGIYIYSYAENEDEGKEYGKYTNKIINEYKMNPTLGIYLDLESNGITKNIGPAKYEEIVRGYMSQVPNARIYTYTNYANTALNTPYLRSLITWIADYRGYCGYNGYYNMWQYTSTGRLNGITGNVDMSKLYFR